MKTYELQVYQNGGWQFDSYFDNRDLVVSEAERLETAARYLGVRVIEETFNEDRQASTYSTIFSRLKQNDEVLNTAKSALKGNQGAEQVSNRPRAGPRKAKKSNGSVAWLLIGGAAMVIIGIFAIIALRGLAGSI
jgi:hypothetical protein